MRVWLARPLRVVMLDSLWRPNPAAWAVAARPATASFWSQVAGSSPGLAGRAPGAEAAATRPSSLVLSADFDFRALQAFPSMTMRAATLLRRPGGYPESRLGHGVLRLTPPASPAPATPTPVACLARPAAARVDNR